MEQPQLHLQDLLLAMVAMAMAVESPPLLEEMERETQPQPQIQTQ